MKRIKVELNAEKLRKKLDIKNGVDGKDGINGVDGISPDPTDIALLATTQAVERLKPLVPDLVPLATELPKYGEPIRDSLELLDGDNRLDKSAIRGIDDYEEISRLAREKTKKIVGGGGGGSGSGGSTSPLTTKGDLYGRSTVDARIPVGADGTFLISDSTQATGRNNFDLFGTANTWTGIQEFDAQINFVGATTFGQAYGGSTIDDHGNLNLLNTTVSGAGLSINAGTGDASFNGNVTAANFFGSGSNLTNLPAGGSPTQLQFNNSGAFGGVTGSGVDNTNGYVGFGQATPLARVHATPRASDTISSPSSLTSYGVLAVGTPLFTANGSQHTFYLYAYRTNVTPTIYAVPLTSSFTDANDSTGYDAQLAWTASSNATGYIVWYLEGNTWYDVGNVVGVTITGDSGTISPPDVTNLSNIYPTAIFDGAKTKFNSLDYFFPSSQTAGVFKNDGIGNLSWGTVPLSDITSVNGQIPFGSGTTLDQSPNLLFVGNRLGVSLGGFSPNTPQTSIDNGGDYSTRANADLATTGTINNLSTAQTSNFRLTGSGTVTATGFTNGTNGKFLYVQTSSVTNLTIVNEGTGSTAANRIVTGTGANLVIPANSVIFLVYNSTETRWRVISYQAQSNPNTWTAKQTFQLTTEQGRWGYNASNYFNVTVDANGKTTLNTFGNSPEFFMGTASVGKILTFKGPNGDTIIQEGGRLDTTRATFYLNYATPRNFDINNGQFLFSSTGNFNLPSATASTLASFDGSKNLVSFTGTVPVANGGTGVDNTTQTYTPTLYNTTNVFASTARQCTYFRVGNVVTVAGQLDIDTTLAASATLLGISLPIASSLTTAYQLGGVAFATGVAGMGAGIEADAANDRASVKFVSTDINNQTMTFTFNYQVI